MEFLLVFLVVLAINLIPAFAPPTWIALVYFSLKFPNSSPPMIILSGLLAAVLGRAVLALSTRRISGRFSSRYRENLAALGNYIERNQSHAFATLMLFFFSPISSAQLFVAAGMLPNLRLARLLIAFAAGRLVSYSTYVLGAHKFAQTDLGAEVTSNFSSPWFIFLQLSLIGLVWLLGRINWKEKLS